MFKKMIGCFAVFTLFYGVLIHSAAAASTVTITEPSIYIDGNKLELNVAPKLIHGTTLVPMRAILEAQDAEVFWDDESQTVKASVHKAEHGDISITYTMGDKTASVRKNKLVKSVSLTVPGQILNGTTLLPLRFFSEALGNEVGWEGKTRSITISTTEKDKFRVTQVFDDDTIGVFWGTEEERIRLIGVEPLSIESSNLTHKTASEYMADWLTGRKVLIEHHDQARDADGNVMGLVYLEDGTLFNSKLIVEGYVQAADNESDHKWATFFDLMQADAIHHGRGLWADTGKLPLDNATE